MKKRIFLGVLLFAVAASLLGVFKVTRHMSVASDGGVDAKMKALFAEPRPVMLEEYSGPKKMDHIITQRSMS